MAQQEAAAAVTLLGGLTQRTKLDDVRARSDFAIAALLNGKPDEARRYLAMTGAGRQDGASIRGGTMTPPDCGGEAGLKPADMAVVEFSIGDDGNIVQVEPVYAAGGGAVAIEFAKAVRDWSWTPEQAKAISLFYRYRVRVEMRCSIGYERPSMARYLNEGLLQWLGTKNVVWSEPPVGGDLKVYPKLRALLSAQEAASGPNSLSVVPILKLIASNRMAPRDEAHAAAVRGLAIVDANQGAGLARLAFVTNEIVTRGAETDAKAIMRDMRNELARPIYADDLQARSALRIIIAAQNSQRDRNVARQLLTQVGDDPALAKTDPLRASALVQLASLEQASGNIAAAKAAFDKSGLDATQCALVDAPPRVLSSGGTFPREAQEWGFEGFTNVQFDVDLEGRVKNERTVLAYPAFVFSKAGSEAIRTSRYSKTYRPDGGVGCGGNMRSVGFRLSY